MDDGNALYRGCFFCRSGKEEAVARHFMDAFKGGKAVAPTKSRFRRVREAAIEERVILFPGYVFFEVDAGDAAQQQRPGPPPGAKPADSLQYALHVFSRASDILKLLKYTNGDWVLHGSDDQFARMLLDADGRIGISQAYFDEGRRIRILDGFLKDYEGAIVRVNRKMRTVEVSVDFQDKKINMRLGYELVTAAEK